MSLPGMISPPGFFKTVVAAGPPVSANLKIHYEMDNSITPTATSWVDEVAGIDLIVQPSMVAPSIILGGTPTGQDYYEFTPNEGLGTILLAGEDLPEGTESRSLYLVCRYPIETTFFHGVVYGEVGSDISFGLIVPQGETTLSIEFFISSLDTTAIVVDNIFHVLLVTYDESESALVYKDNVEFIPTGTATTNTSLVQFYINEQLTDDPSRFIDVSAILLYAGEHNAADRLATFNYLNDKYIGA